MALVCTVHQRPWKTCECGLDAGAWVYVTKAELSHYCKTGLIPDLAAGLYHYEGKARPAPIPLVHPPQYDFKVA